MSEGATGSLPRGDATASPYADLLALREEFPILARTTYLINNSLGAMPRGVRDELAAFADAWDHRGVRAWHEGWWEMAVETGDLLAPLLGVGHGEIAMHQNVSVAAAVFLSCLDYPSARNRIVLAELEFPTLRYLVEGERRRGAGLVEVPSDDGIGIDLDRLLAAIDERTRVAVVSHVLFKSAFVQDAAAIARRCREVGALLLLDVYQSAGTLPLALAEWGVDAAVGGSVKWLCGGPGAGYLWIRPELLEQLAPVDVGWFSHENPFEMDIHSFRYAGDARRFWGGTPSVAPFVMAAASLRHIRGIGVDNILAHNRRLVRLFRDALTPAWRGRLPAWPTGGTLCISTGADLEGVTRALTKAGAQFDSRGDVIRISFHACNTDDDALRVAQAWTEN